MTDDAHITQRRVRCGGIQLNVMTAGSGDEEPVLLLHGWPETALAWRKLVPLLARHRLIMPDLRGLGGSDTVDASYDKLSVAEDMATLIADVFDLRDVFVVGHDWGGVAAFYTAWLLAERAKGLAVLDVTIPNDLGAGPDISQGGQRWHHAFHRSGLAETLIVGKEKEYYTWFYETLGATPGVIDPETITSYIDAYRGVERTRAGLGYYHSIPDDIANARKVGAGGLAIPVLALGGDSSWGRGDEPRQSLSYFAEDVTGGPITNCGHWIPEEQPHELARRLTEFFAHCRAGEQSP
ncbi:alpha/beta fold hydrolase [Stackebrandtia soli]|uniref:alpha/beta fold hydrolase n=1 Tax=Stackebrandtia soli TaxID=1892856 RepID=UPI0039EA89DA